LTVDMPRLISEVEAANISEAIREIKALREVAEAARYIEDNLGHWFLNPSGASELKEAMHRQRCAIKKLDEARRG
jgi:transposase